MTFDALLFQALNGLAAASGLFLVGAGLSLIFGVTRIVNIAHGSLYMLGIYLAYTLRHEGRRRARLLGRHRRGRARSSPLIGALIEIAAAAAHLPRAGAVPAARHLRAGAGHQRRGAVDLGPGGSARAARARPARRGRNPRPPVSELRPVPDRRRARSCSSCCICVLARTRFGRLVRAATQDREMVGALGVNQAVLFTAVFALGAFLAGLGGALQVAARAGQPADGPHRDRRRLRGRRGRRHGLDHRRLSRRRADRRDQGAVHRHRRGRISAASP